MQVEEEEEAGDNDESDRNTYTIEEDYQMRQRYPRSSAVRSKTSTDNQQRRSNTRKSRDPGAGDYCPDSRLPIVSRPERGSGTDMITKMKDQLDATTDMCQHLLKQQRKLQLQLSGESITSILQGVKL